MQSSLILHRGAQQITETELLGFLAPEPRGRWYPLAHSRVLDVVKESLEEVGYEVARQILGVMRDGSQFFGVLDLKTQINDGVSLSCGVRNSINQSLPIGFVAGSRVFVCDNLAFRSELTVHRRHTLNGERDFVAQITKATAQLSSFANREMTLIDELRERELTADQADAFILRSFERGIISSRELPKVLHEWRNPPFAEFQPRTAWSLLNAYTSALKERAETNPQQHSAATMRLQSLFSQASLN